jgi:hypothetical protein
MYTYHLLQYLKEVYILPPECRPVLVFHIIVTISYDYMDIPHQLTEIHNGDAIFYVSLEQILLTWSLSLRKEDKMNVSENRVLRKIFSSKRDEIIGGWKKLHIEELHNLNSYSN